MWKSFKYLYYKLYKLFVRINGKDDIPEYTAMFAVGTLFFCNLFAIVSVVNVFSPFWNYPDISRGRFFIYLIPYTLIFYFTLVFNGKYKKIINEFEIENEERRKKGRLNIVIYIALSLLLLIFAFILMTMKTEGVIGK